jgi:predicted membrane channel-forming protein YqfA (hemolysin III family)
MVRSPKAAKITFWERTLSALIIAIIAALFCLALSFLLIRTANFGTDTAQFVLNIYWESSLVLITVSAILGFVLGGSRMAHIVGIIFRTNKPKDGNWF